MSNEFASRWGRVSEDRMRHLFLSVLIAASLPTLAMAQSTSSSSAASSGGGCTVENTASGSSPSNLKGSATAGGISTSVTAGGGHVSTNTTGAKGLSVDVRSSDGKATASVTVPEGSRAIVSNSGANGCDIRVEK